MTGKYEFIEDRIVIVDPSIIEIDEEGIRLNNIDKTLSVKVVLQDPSGSKFAPPSAFSNIPRDSETWDDCDLIAIVSKRLEEFKIED